MENENESTESTESTKKEDKNMINLKVINAVCKKENNNF